jgi:hypothetical protein
MMGAEDGGKRKLAGGRKRKLAGARGGWCEEFQLQEFQPKELLATWLERSSFQGVTQGSQWLPVQVGKGSHASIIPTMPLSRHGR